MKRCLLIPAFFLCFFNLVSAQQKHTFWNEVQTFKAYDLQITTPAHPIVFVGSSSIRKWDDLQIALGTYNVMNRGIGGAVINDIVFYLNELVFTYQPRQIVLYVGENDLPDASVTPDTVLNRTKLLFSQIRAKLPEVPIVYIAMKPSPSRIAVLSKAREANLLVYNFIKSQKNAAFVNIFSPMLTKDGKPRPELFQPDMLHMNLKGYTIWETAIRPYLLKY